MGWDLARVKTLIGLLLHVPYTVKDTWQLVTVSRRIKQVQYRPKPLAGCLVKTGLTTDD
ncbi:hypothetical protein [Kitasatospora sp. NPDC056531]|uniref:hypothetical protein n=1 Tax=Kitasatospora sp. NPDC056531 TaxID=3345856 RepID=UPI0036B5F033